MLAEETEISLNDIIFESAKEVFEAMIFMNVEETFDHFDATEDGINASILYPKWESWVRPILSYEKPAMIAVTALI